MTDTQAALLEGKVRRLEASLRGDQPDASRAGACTRCGACCRILVTCPYLDESGEEAACAVYERRPVVCRLFPFDQADLDDIVLMGESCGYWFAAGGAG